MIAGSSDPRSKFRELTLTRAPAFYRAIITDGEALELF